MHVYEQFLPVTVGLGLGLIVVFCVFLVCVGTVFLYILCFLNIFLHYRESGCYYQCNQLPTKTRLRNNLSSLIHLVTLNVLHCYLCLR